MLNKCIFIHLLVQNLVQALEFFNVQSNISSTPFTAYDAIDWRTEQLNFTTNFNGIPLININSESSLEYNPCDYSTLKRGVFDERVDQWYSSSTTSRNLTTTSLKPWVAFFSYEELGERCGGSIPLHLEYGYYTAEIFSKLGGT